MAQAVWRERARTRTQSAGAKPRRPTGWPNILGLGSRRIRVANESRNMTSVLDPNILGEQRDIRNFWALRRIFQNRGESSGRR